MSVVQRDRPAALDMRQLLREVRLVPVLTIERLADAVPLARALIAAGLRALEITLRTPVALDAVRAIAREVPDAAVGVGTVLEPADLLRAQGAGARFAFSPGFTSELLIAAEGGGIPFIPGVATAAEIMQARARGYRLLKFFPAEQSGGIAALKAHYGPIPDVSFCPTGGVGAHNMKEYLAQPNVVAVGGSFPAPAADLAAQRWDAIRDHAKELRAQLNPSS
ncbi:MAG: bifunctional 4-hydroxy-2-oxoglutarate aldolase/2-dehydro-3-deoxy-phosphogluconate aldolase [Alphaproteobacteria bacterium]|nr:bifunctional 4-hydroxy-2-oxoglutarate aldolase/2-dehydro-3-deoxy-phosphogluconate aldolase [Alphaproteobacteria bacterium]